MKVILLFLMISSAAFTKEYDAILTAYCSCQKCCSWKYNEKGVPVFNYGKLKGKPKVVGKTASGKMAKKEHTLAMPNFFPFGTNVYYKGGLLGVCEDRGGAIKKRKNLIKIDLYMESHKKALEFGVQRVKVNVDTKKEFVIKR